jgi:hypothetical protein
LILPAGKAGDYHEMAIVGLPFDNDLLRPLSPCVTGEDDSLARLDAILAGKTPAGSSGT